MIIIIIHPFSGLPVNVQTTLHGFKQKTQGFK
jgi:hypothetical protein